MTVKYIIFSLFSVAFINANSQATTGFKNEDSTIEVRKPIPDKRNLDFYHDSLMMVYNQDLLVGHVVSSYSEPIEDIVVDINFDNTTREVKTDNWGRFFSVLPDSRKSNVSISIHNNDFYGFDTTLSPNILGEYVLVKLIPKYKIELRGQVFIGSLPAEDVDVSIAHLTDTFKLKTLGCFTDSEHYWNCLYRGMFKQSISFEDTDDSLLVKLSKRGFDNHELKMKVSDYDGNIISVKLNYSEFLPYSPTHNISLKIALPITKTWLVTADYTFLPKIKNFQRLGLGIEGGISVTNHATSLKTFPIPNSLPDSSFYSTTVDSSYTSAVLIPHLTLWLTKPDRRKYSLYTGIGLPYYFQSSYLGFQPFFGGRFFLDFNKAILFEIKYTQYSLNIYDYTFNSYGKIKQEQISKEFNNLLINFGLQISF